ncbi:uncharacterized protein C11orf97 homolog [Mesoplodon densirostris]|uniref:uncharacterized protein C11orf97 homolog n=1 Tax=Mesoplodon densirostris TaxID=48708 RepID=UPI0028DB2223|nr:uncharacterized protein C11orf97 homolog [Mesoplodon densirostris]
MSPDIAKCFLLLRRSREGQPAARREEDPRGKRGEEAVTAVAMPEAGRDSEQPWPPGGLGCGARGETGGRGLQESRKQRKKFLYCEPHKRIKEVLEEELYIKRDECHIKHPPAVVLEGIWSIKRNLSVGGLKPGLPSRNSLLPQAKYYSRHRGLRKDLPAHRLSGEESCTVLSSRQMICVY